MSRLRAGILLWGAAVLLVPLPYWIIADGRVPVARFAMRGAVSAAYSATVDGSGVAWTMTWLLAAHVVLFSLALGAATVAIVWVIPERTRRGTVWTAIAVAFLVALLFDVYRTPFDDVWARSSWLGLFQ
jgi:hypothetical protein